MFDTLVILCPGLPSSKENGRIVWDAVSGDLYLGGMVRMNAAKRFIEQHQPAHIILAAARQKSYGVYSFLTDDGDALRRGTYYLLSSDNDTNGNLHAVQQVLANELSDLKIRKLGLLTNLYHLPRSLRFARDIMPEYELVPIPAEDYIDSKDCERYQREYLARTLSEMRGIVHWELGVYRDQNKIDWTAELLAVHKPTAE